MSKRCSSSIRRLSRAYSSTSTTTTTTTTGSSFPLKNVTKSNFESSLKELKEHVRAADFIAIDLEMSGITSAPWRDSFEFDRSDVRYLKIKDSADKFAVVQFGVCPFRWDPLNQSFISHPHNFFVFPRQELGIDGPSYEFLCQSTSIDFLAKYQFDFNACVNQGVSYLSRVQEEAALKRLDLLFDNDELSDTLPNLKQVQETPLVSMADILFTERIKIKLSEWRGKLLKDRNWDGQFHGSSNDSKQQFETVFFKMRPALSLKGFTSHQLRLIQFVTKKNFDNLVYVHVGGDNSCLQQLVVYTDSEADNDLLMKEVRDEQRKVKEMKVQSAIGFRHVIDLLSSEKKLIVGHNCFLDIAHVYKKFFGPLPSTANEFVASVNKYFPYIIDTKLLLNSNLALHQRMKKTGTSLSRAFSSLCPQIALGSESQDMLFKTFMKVEVRVDDMRSSNWNSGAKHEAGYDAFMTGCVFAQACSHIGMDFQQHLPSENLAHHEKLQKYLNHLYLSWTNGDIIDLTTGKKVADSPTVYKNLKKHHREILFENIVLMWGFPPKLKASEIEECISKVFGSNSVSCVYHIDETAVFVQFSKEKLVSDFLELKTELEKSDGPISVLHPLSKLLDGGNTRATSYEIYKEICSSPISKVSFSDQAEAVGFTRKLNKRNEVRKQVLDSVVYDNEEIIDSIDSEQKRTATSNL
ncbi:hypothetical protein ACFE04_022079 [Oxalis oulophora]